MNYYEEDNFILLRIFILIILSIIRGRYFKWIFNYSLKFIFLFKAIKLLIIYLLVIRIFIMIFIILNLNYFKNIIFFNYINSYIWFIRLFTLNLFNLKILNLSFNLNKYFDKGWIEWIFIKNLNNLLKFLMNYLLKFQFNYFKFLIFFFIFFILLLFLVYLNSLNFRVWYWRYQGNCEFLNNFLIGI
jgi:hypothetical protein